MLLLTRVLAYMFTNRQEHQFIFSFIPRRPKDASDKTRQTMCLDFGKTCDKKDWTYDLLWLIDQNRVLVHETVPWGPSEGP